MKDKYLLGSVLRNPPLLLGLSFLILIFLGAVLLNLPMASSDGKSVGFINALFTSTSASCVTGLIVRNTAEGWSIFGKVIIISLIQIGGVGTMTIIAIISVLIGKKIGLRERMVIREQLNMSSLTGMVKLIKFVLLSSFAIEFIGALLLSIRLIPMYGFEKGIAYSIFHGISAFCNAGFDIFGNSLVDFHSDVLLNLVIAFLVILGGLGFAVYLDFTKKQERKRLMPHTKLVLLTSVLLLLFGTVLLYIFEKNNPGTMGNFSEKDKWLAAFFQSAIFRTAGFNSIDLAALNDSSKFVSIFLMFIGGSPGSTAGGLKTTTMAILIVGTIAGLREQEDVNLFRRKVPEELIKKSFSIFFIATILICAVAVGIVSIENNRFTFMEVLFETVSAFGTVGVTLGITSELSAGSKLILSLLMFLGRVGPTTFAMGLLHRGHKKRHRYAEGRFLVG